MAEHPTQPMGLIERLAARRKALEAGDATGGPVGPVAQGLLGGGSPPRASKRQAEKVETPEQPVDIQQQLSMLERFLRRFRGQGQFDNPSRSR